jgi:excisionase family DNA binding protein
VLQITPAPLLKRGEVARLLRVHEKTVELWVRTGRLRAVHPGPGTIRFRVEDVLELIEGADDRKPP